MNSRDCPVCFVVYDDPRCLPCGHSFCLRCISRIAGDRRNFRCPCCNGNVELDFAGAEGLPKNYCLTSVIQDLPSSTCSEHNKTLDMFCAECSVTICYKCIFGSHSGHKIEDIDVVFSKRKEIITNFLESTKQWQSMIKEQTDTTMRSHRSMQEKADLIKSRINDTFQKWHDALEKRKHYCMEHLDEETGKRKKVFDGNMSICERVNTDINNLTTRMNTILSEDKASVLQQFGILTERYEKVRKEVMQDWDVTFITPDDLKIGIHALWMEEVVGNIKLIDTSQTEESSPEENLYNIIEVNQNLKREKRETELQRDRLTAYNQQLKEELEKRSREEREKELQIDQLTACNAQLKEKLKRTKSDKRENEAERTEREATEIDQLKTSNRQLAKNLKKMKRENRENELTIDHLTDENKQLKEELEKGQREKIEKERKIYKLTAYSRQLNEQLESMKREEDRWRKPLYELKEMVANISDKDENYKSRNDPTPGPFQFLVWKTYVDQLKEDLEKAIRIEQTRRRQLSEVQEMVSRILKKDEK